MVAATARSESPVLITRREAAKRLGISEKSLDTATKRGEIPCVRINDRLVRYSIPALDRMIEEKLAANAAAE